VGRGIPRPTRRHDRSHHRSPFRLRRGLRRLGGRGRGRGPHVRDERGGRRGVRGVPAGGRAGPAGLTDEQAYALITAKGSDLEAVCRLVDDLHRDTVGDEVTYVVNRNINFTNVCYVG
jgi:FO synthase